MGRMTRFVVPGVSATRSEAWEDAAMSARPRRAEQMARPVGSAAFIADVERQTGRRLAPGSAGPKPSAKGGS